MTNIDFSVSIKGPVLMYANAWGEFPIPNDVVVAATKENDGRDILDMRTKGYKRHVKPFEEQLDAELERIWNMAAVKV